MEKRGPEQQTGKTTEKTTELWGRKRNRTEEYYTNKPTCGDISAIFSLRMLHQVKVSLIFAV